MSTSINLGLFSIATNKGFTNVFIRMSFELVHGCEGDFFFLLQTKFNCYNGCYRMLTKCNVCYMSFKGSTNVVIFIVL
jgi:hypothetical protein